MPFYMVPRNVTKTPTLAIALILLTTTTNIATTSTCTGTLVLVRAHDLAENPLCEDRLDSLDRETNESSGPPRALHAYVGKSVFL